MKKTETVKLPKQIKKSDLKEPGYKSKSRLSYDDIEALGMGYSSSFELWYTTGFGWVIPTLLISKSRNQYANRTYAVTLDEEKLVSVGLGPHVTQQVRIYVTKKNVARLKPIIDLMKQGSVKANEYRDRLSTRRANSRRTSYRYF